MATTSNYSLPYPAAGDAPDGPGAFYSLAQAADAAIGAAINSEAAARTAAINAEATARASAITTEANARAALAAISVTDQTPGASLVGDWNNAGPGMYRINGSQANQNSPIGGGAYGFGVLSVFGSNGGATVQMYVTDGYPNTWIRTRWTDTWSPWVLLNNPGVFTGTGNFASGWNGVRSNMVRWGPIVHFEFSATRSGGTITSGPTGNIANVQLGNVGTWIPNAAWAPLAAGAGGPTASFAVDGAGKLFLAALPPSYSLTNGQELTCGGSWVTSAP